ncbi:hypothetical protein SEUCBS140593_002795 [Sporothrix eucalyptigena]|uniref:Uncharacterized protein n=1 Tax=Sporothrix eucalyptigena TaxID=1812306 RepID=A0ABP0BAJ0_9PEZI
MDPNSVHQPPTDQERDLFFYGLPSTPRLVARTDSSELPWIARMSRGLEPVTDDDLVRQWNASRTDIQTRISAVLAEHSVDWTIYLPLVVNARKINSWNDRNRHASEGLVPGILHSLQLLPVDLYYLLLSAVTCMFMSQSSQHLSNIFDKKSGATGFDYLIRVRQVNEAILRFLPYPGQLIEQAASDTKQGSRGSLGCYVRLKNKNGSAVGGLFGLTSRHVAVGNMADHDKLYMAPPIVDTLKDDLAPMSVAWGSVWYFQDSLSELNKNNRGLSYVLHIHRKRLLGGEPSNAELELLDFTERCQRDYIPAIREVLEREIGDGDTSRRGSLGRTIGHVAVAGRHGHNARKGWSDWCLISPDDNNGKTNGTGEEHDSHEPTSGSLCDYYQNRVYMGAFIGSIYNTLLSNEAEDSKLLALQDLLDSEGFLALKAPSRPWVDNIGLDPTKPRPGQYVFKRGAISGMTVGQVSPIEAVLRKPLQGRDDAIAWSWPVLPLLRVLSSGIDVNPSFSMKGDSGSTIFNSDGEIIAMIDAGVTSDEPTCRLFHQHPADPSLQSAAPLPLDKMMPPQTPVPEPFVSWNAEMNLPQTKSETQSQPSKPRHHDITLATPIEWLFEDIELQTDFKPWII